MANEIASLVVAVDATSAEAAVRKLDALHQASARAVTGQAGLASSSTKATAAADQLNASTTKLARSTDTYVKSAKELRFATRNLPAQFTDIAVSLQAGQNPLTVLLQQGGQLKDMFGGIGPAARAMGSYIVGLVNPYMIAAVAVGALAAAFVKGEAETVAFSKSIEMTGNFAGTTTDSLNDMARGMAEFGTSQGKAAAALSEVTAAGKFTEAQIKQIGQAAIDMERATGQAVGDTVKEFAKLGDSPVKAALELNDTFHFLTTSTYEQIKALEQQGDTLGAAKVAMDAYADAIEDRTEGVEQNLGTLQKGWRAVAGAAAAAWDAMLNIGREETGQQKFDSLFAKLQELENPSNFMSYAHLSPEQKKQQIAQIRLDLKELSDARVTEQKRLNAETQGRLAAETAMDLDQEAGRYADNATKRKNERLAVETRSNEAYRIAMQQGNKSLAESIRADEATILAGIDAKYKPKKGREDKSAERALKAQQAEYERLTKSIGEHTAIAKKDSEQQEELTANQKFAEKILYDLAEGHTKLNKEQIASVKVALNELLAIDAVNVAREKKIKLLEIDADANDRLAEASRNRAADAARELRSLTMGSTNNELASRMDDVRDFAAQERLDLAKEYGAQNALNSQEHLAQIKRIDNAERVALQNELGYLEQRRAAQADWRNGARRALEDIADEANDVAGRTESGFRNAFSALNQMVDTFAETGKLKMRDFATVVLAELAKIMLQMIITKTVMMMMGATGGGADFSGVSGGGAAPSVGTGPYAQGGVFSGGAQLTGYALGGLPFAGRGGVRSSPTLFAMANGGTGLMAEQGPEAVMPLSRGADGKLGVKSQGGGGMVINVNTSVNIDSAGGATSDTEAKSENEEASKLGAILNKKIRDVLVEERRQGGILWGMVNGR